MTGGSETITIQPRAPAGVGEPAPDFTLPTVPQEGVVSLADYRGKSPVLLAIMRGLWCPFCRRHLAQLGTTQEKLQAVGIETLAIVATKPERARLYFQFHPTRVSLAADTELTTHQAYGLPKPVLTPEVLEAAQPLRINPTGDLPEPVPLLQGTDILNRLDGFQLTETD